MRTTRRSLEERLGEIAGALPLKKLRQLVDFAQYLSSREEWEATLELLSDPGMARDIEEGKAQASKGEGRNWREIQKELSSSN